MTQMHLDGRERSSRRARALHVRTLSAVLAVAALAIAVPAGAGEGEGEWTLQLETIAMDVYGHDQHVLTIHRIDPAATPPGDERTGVNLDTGSGLAYRFELQYRKGLWGCGVDFSWFITAQDAVRTASGTPVAPVQFEVADRRFTSAGPGEVLYYQVLEDTDVATWSFDLYGIRTLAETDRSALELRFGVRAADFDNDYRAVVGITDVAGRRLDGSSNYGLMLGPNVGLAAELERDRSTIKAYLGQAVILGSAELAGMTREFAGPFVESPAYFTRDTFFAEQDVAIPISELRLKWTYRITDWLALGLGAHGSAWWDVPVPPGVIPAPGGTQVQHENTLVYLGWIGAVELSF